MNIITYIYQNYYLLGLFFLLGGIIFSKKGRGGNMSLVGGSSLIFGVCLVIYWVIQNLL